jgi:hypothetical protein
MAQELPLNTVVPLTVPKIEVIGPNAKPLPPGRYTFQLTVVDSLDIESAAATVDVLVAGTPTAGIKQTPANPVPAGQTFVLDGSSSASPNGAIKTFNWKRTK